MVFDSTWVSASFAQTQPAVQPTAQPSTPDQLVGLPTAPGAQPVETTGVPLTPGGAPVTASRGMDPIMWLLPVMLVVMILVSVMGSRKEKKRQAALLASVSKGDRVQMMGGIIGTVVEMSDTDVVLRVEEGRIRFARTAIQGLVQPGKSAATLEAKPEVKVTV